MKPPADLTPTVGDPVQVDTWPGAQWRVVKAVTGDMVDTFRMVRTDRSGGSRVELAGIPASRMSVVNG